MALEDKVNPVAASLKYFASDYMFCDYRCQVFLLKVSLDVSRATRNEDPLSYKRNLHTDTKHSTQLGVSPLMSPSFLLCTD